jgi:type II secretory pathway pseudopilin PulG
MLVLHFDRRAASLVELLVVLAIMGVMLSLLLPALQSARESANETVCKNNLHQLNIAMHAFRGTHKRLPGPNLWAIELLKFVEEDALAKALWNRDPITVKDAKVLPPIYTCTAQSEVDSTVSGTPIGHYVFVIDVAGDRRGDRKISWRITDRPADLPAGELPPWYVGPEALFAEFKEWVENTAGPHRGGVFFPE